MTHCIVWFDLPVADLARAMGFYRAVLEAEVNEEFPGVAVFAHGDGEVSGCLFKSDDRPPGPDGVLVYFNVNGRLEPAVDAATAHGGHVEQSPHDIGPFGRRAIVIDSEGNRIALHSE